MGVVCAGLVVCLFRVCEGFGRGVVDACGGLRWNHYGSLDFRLRFTSTGRTLDATSLIESSEDL